MIVWFMARLGLSRTGTIIFLVIALIIFGWISFEVWYGVTHSKLTAQTEQTTRSGDAISNAGAAAINTITNAQDRDASIDNVTSETQRNIDNAPNSSVGRNAVISGMCRYKEYRNDPACVVR